MQQRTKLRHALRTEVELLVEVLRPVEVERQPDDVLQAHLRRCKNSIIWKINMQEDVCGRRDRERQIKREREK